MATAKQLAHFLQEWLGTSRVSDLDIVSVVEAGLPLSVVRHLIERGLSRDEIYRAIINPRTLKHRRSKHQVLSKEESERAVRTARILARAQAVLGDRQVALNWLRAPKRRFDGRSPMQMLSTEIGGRLVEEMLIQIDEGMFA